VLIHDKMKFLDAASFRGFDPCVKALTIIVVNSKTTLEVKRFEGLV